MKSNLRKALLLTFCLFFSQSVMILPTQAESDDKNITLQSSNQSPNQNSLQSQNLALLIQSVRQFITNNSFEMQSNLNINGNFSGGSVNFFIKINTVMEAPEKFRSQINFSNPNGQDGKQYVVVSDGEQVWIHSLNEEKYSLMEYDSFKESDDFFLIGIISSIMAEFWANIEDIDVLMSLPEEELIRSLETELATDVSQIDYGLETRDENEYATYSFTEQEKGFKMKAFINTANAEVEYLQMETVEDDISIVMEEKVMEKTNIQMIPAVTFEFLPPINVEKVDQPLSIEPF